MRPNGPPTELERRRRLAVQRVLEGYSNQEVADFLGVDPSSVRRWLAAFRRHGEKGLTASPVPGRPPKLTSTQEKVVRRRLAGSPPPHGYAPELWTGPRLAPVIEEEFGVRSPPGSLSRWLRGRGFAPQKPERVPRQRDPEAIARWLEADWPRIKKRPGARGR